MNIKCRPYLIGTTHYHQSPPSIHTRPHTKAQHNPHLHFLVLVARLALHTPRHVSQAAVPPTALPAAVPFREPAKPAAAAVAAAAAGVAEGVAAAKHEVCCFGGVYAEGVVAL